MTAQTITQAAYIVAALLFILSPLERLARVCPRRTRTERPCHIAIASVTCRPTPLQVAMQTYSIVNILFTRSRYFGNRKSGFPCFSSWIFPTIQFHASLSNLPPTQGRRHFSFAPHSCVPMVLKIARG